MHSQELLSHGSFPGGQILSFCGLWGCFSVLDSSKYWFLLQCLMLATLNVTVAAPCSGLSCLILRIFELWCVYSQQHRTHCKTVSSLLVHGWGHVLGWGVSKELDGLGAEYEEGEKKGMTRFLYPELGN